MSDSEDRKKKKKNQGSPPAGRPDTKVRELPKPDWESEERNEGEERTWE